MIAVTIYSRPGCHLCDDMKALLTKVNRSIPLSIEEIDIYADDELEELYGLEIPVLFVEGKKIAAGRITEDALVRILTSRALFGP
jgi:glutaredoxin